MTDIRELFGVEINGLEFMVPEMISKIYTFFFFFTLNAMLFTKGLRRRKPGQHNREAH